MNCRMVLLLMVLLSSISVDLAAEEVLTLENVTRVGKIKVDEPLTKEFSMQQAVSFLDQAALDWTKNRECFACHTNYAYLIARPKIDFSAVAHQQVRKSLEDMVTKRWQEQGPRWDAEVLMTAHTLALNDATTTGKLAEPTRVALDRMWTVQRDDGGFSWLKCGWPPMESDDDFAVPVVAIAVAAAPDNYNKTEQAVRGIEKLRQYLAKNPPPTLHHEAMLLWADSLERGWLSDEKREGVIGKLKELQLADGSWALASLGNWEREDGSPQTKDQGDGYATGFVSFVLHRAGVKSSDPALQKSLSWLRANQRTSGRWFTRSLHKDSQHYISNAGSAFAVLALKECEAD